MQSISNILIANRGEIARRIIRTAKSMGIATFAIYTDEEKNALHVREANNSHSIGHGKLADTYLNIPLLIRIAKENNCDAIHPGYGFLSENAAFAEACREAGIIFIGPDPLAIRLMGDKTEARKYVQNLGIPLPWSVSASSFKEISKQINKLVFPVMIKAVAGGGGKGMRIVYSSRDLAQAFESASREALAYFGNSGVYLEQYIEDARHIEVQVLGDNHGNIVHLYDRECTIQRRHQKIIEEAPSPTLSGDTRNKLLETALSIARALNYTSAGTLEFLLDKHSNFYFLEMNTRIQVEHPVTEAITNIDIVKEQIRIAGGLPLSFSQSGIIPKGHAIECRIYAEDPFTGFLPSSGQIALNHLPSARQIRIDTASIEPTVISSSFDPMIAKIIAHSNTRDEARLLLKSYLKNTAIQGIKTNVEYLSEILDDADYISNRISTTYCDTQTEKLKVNLANRKENINPSKLIAIALIHNFKTRDNENKKTIWQYLGPWRYMGNAVFSIDAKPHAIAYQFFNKNRIGFFMDGVDYLIEVVENQEPVISFLLNGEKSACLVSDDKNGIIYANYEGLSFEISRSDLPDTTIFSNKTLSYHHNGNHVLSPINGKVIMLNVRKGDKVIKGETLMVIESMKMENRILAPGEAVVSEIMVADGDQVVGRELLIKLSTLN